MNGIKTENKWQSVEEKKEALRKLTDEKWESGDWELASLGERVLRTVTEWSEAVEILNDRMSELSKQQGRDYADRGLA